jgi:hypothetical protein
MGKLLTKEILLCQEVMEQVPRKAAGVDAEEWEDRFPPDQAEIAFAQNVELKFNIFRGSLAVSAVVRSVDSG